MIDHTNKLIGVIERDEALGLAEAAGLDLVEIQANQRPPLCKIMDFGKYKYEQSKKKSAQNKTNKANEVKEVRLGRSVKIDKHDVQLRVAQARKFLLDGHKVVIVQRFRGREMAHPEIGQERLVAIKDQLGEIANVVAPPSMSGRQMSMTLQPDKNKVETYKRKHAIDEAPPVPEPPEDDIDDDDDDDDIDEVQASAEAPPEAASEAPPEAAR